MILALLAFPLILTHKHSTLSSPTSSSRQSKHSLTYRATPPPLLPCLALALCGAPLFNPPKAKDKALCLRAGGTHPSLTPWQAIRSRPAVTMLTSALLRHQHTLSPILVHRERDNFQQENDIQVQFRAGDHTRSPTEQSAVVCRAATGVRSH